MAPPKKSGAWKYFIKNDCGSAKCKLCLAFVKTKGNTTNLQIHLRRHHQELEMPNTPRARTIFHKVSILLYNINLLTILYN